MIPSMIVLGLLAGWWWRSTLVAAPLLWAAALVIDGAVPLSDPLMLLGGALLGAANAAVGVAVVQGARWSVRGGTRISAAVRPLRGSPNCRTDDVLPT